MKDDLFEAAEDGTASEVRAALSAGADPNARAEADSTPLHWAARKGTPPRRPYRRRPGARAPGSRDGESGNLAARIRGGAGGWRVTT